MPKSERSKLRAKCIELAKKIAKTRDRYVCQKCNTLYLDDHKGGMHGSHVFAVSRCARLACDPVNIKALCAKCHFWWHEHPIESGHWFREHWPDRMEYLEAQLVVNRQLGTIPIQWWRDRSQELNDELRALQ